MCILEIFVTPKGPSRARLNFRLSKVVLCSVRLTNSVPVFALFVELDDSTPLQVILQPSDTCSHFATMKCL